MSRLGVSWLGELWSERAEPAKEGAVDYLIEIEPELRAAERERRLERARLYAGARLPPPGHPVLARIGHLLTRSGTRLEAWAEPGTARSTRLAPVGGVSSKEAPTPC